MDSDNKRLEREKQTVEIMIGMRCTGKHHTRDKLCKECSELLAYARKRIDGCRFAGSKPVCSKCSTHCYKNDMKDRIIHVMRYSGPRMLFVHPVLAVRHLIDLLVHNNPKKG